MSPYGDGHCEHANSYVPLQQMDDGLRVPGVFFGYIYVWGVNEAFKSKLFVAHEIVCSLLSSGSDWEAEV